MTKSIAQIVAEAIVNDQLALAGLDLAAATPEARSEAARKSWLTRKRRMEEQGKAGGGAHDEKVEPPQRPPARPPREISFSEMQKALIDGLGKPPGYDYELDKLEFDHIIENSDNKTFAKKEVAKRLMLHSGGRITSDDSAHITDVWARTSADDNTSAILLQKKAHDVFGEGDLDPFIKNKYDAMYNEDAYLGWGYSSKNSRSIPMKEVAAKQELYLKSMQRNTQRWLKQHGMEPDDEVTLYRGYSTKDMGGRGPDWKVGKEIKVTGNPITSWSLSESISSTFGSGSYGVVVKRKVKVRDIVGMCRSGLGCLNEQEFVLANQHGKTATIEAMQNSGY